MAVKVGAGDPAGAAAKAALAARESESVKAVGNLMFSPFHFVVDGSATRRLSAA
jgi:hypothetical protein